MCIRDRIDTNQGVISNLGTHWHAGDCWSVHNSWKKRCYTSYRGRFKSRHNIESMAILVSYRPSFTCVKKRVWQKWKLWCSQRCLSLTLPECSPVITMETFDFGVSFYGNKHGIPRGVKLKYLCKHSCFYCVVKSDWSAQKWLKFPWFSGIHMYLHTLLVARAPTHYSLNWEQ